MLVSNKFSRDSSRRPRRRSTPHRSFHVFAYSTMPLPKAALISLSLVPVVVPAVYLAVVQVLVLRQIATAGTAKRILTKKDKLLAETSAATAENSAPPKSIPEHLLDDAAPYIVACERVVSRPIPASALTDPILVDAAASDKQKTSFLLTSYLRGTMSAFAWTPQGLLMKSVVADAAVRRTFCLDYIRGLTFVAGDLACGAYQVTYRAGAEGDISLSRDRVELSIVPLAGRPDLVVHGVVVTGIERTPTEVVFVNETWMWRHATDEKPTLIEGAVGRWLHSLVGGWMILKGTKTVTAPVKVKAE